MPHGDKRHVRFVLAAIAALVFSASARAQAPDEAPDVGLRELPEPAPPSAAPVDREPAAGPQAPAVPDTPPAPEMRPPSPPAVSERPAPPLPTAEELRALGTADPRTVRSILRRAARTSPDADRRRAALDVLAARDPTRATARICARLLRIDPDPLVRRKAAECLGRLPTHVASGQTVTLVAALDDEVLDVVTMAGWALSNVGEPEALGPVAARVSHDDHRVARLFVDYSERLRTRHGLQYSRADEAPGGMRLVPAPTRLISQVDGIDTAASTGWLGLYGGMAGWLHGGLFTAAFGGPGIEGMAPLVGIAGAFGGALAGGAYGFFRADRLLLAHTAVQMGTLGTLVGYGAGVLSGFPPDSGLNMASYGLAGTLIGTTAGVVLNELQPVTPGALTLGATVGLGTSVAFTGLALGNNLDLQSSLGLGMLAAGVTGGVTTLAAAPFDVGLLPCVGATMGGVAAAALIGVATNAVEAVQLSADITANPFTEGSGWAVATGYATGAIIGGTAALLLPESWDPFRTGSVELSPPTMAALPSLKDPRQAIPVATLGGTF